jgi:hypothetical protein
MYRLLILNKLKTKVHLVGPAMLIYYNAQSTKHKIMQKLVTQHTHIFKSHT